MQPLVLSGLTAVTSAGQGADALFAALRDERRSLRPCDFAGVSGGGYVGMVDACDDQPIAPEFSQFDCRNNRLADLALRADGFSDLVDEARARHGAGRIAVVLGTSTSGILSTEDAYRRRDPATGKLPPDLRYDRTHDLFSLARYVRAVLRLRGPALTVSTACASRARSFIDAYHLIASGVCDAAVVGGADSLCRMTLQGFAALDLISAGPCRPCDAARAGISIGEAAGFALLERPDAAAPRRQGANTVAPIALLGYGASSDGYHMSSPDPHGAGAIAAMRDALATAGATPGDIDYVNLHGTGTRANDAMEDTAVFGVFGDTVPCSSTKGWTGHTLGASGIVEAMIAALCIRNEFVPGCLGVTELDPNFRSRVLVRNTASRVRRVMSNAFGFGGINCSLLFGDLA
jgi:3-oxoacyl-[acyl-carrier-protein] synthase-1